MVDFSGRQCSRILFPLFALERRPLAAIYRLRSVSRSDGEGEKLRFS
jgi:hypothetical protein